MDEVGGSGVERGDGVNGRRVRSVVHAHMHAGIRGRFTRDTRRVLAVRWWERASERLTDAASEVQVVHGNGDALNGRLRRVAQHALDAVLEARMALGRLDRLAVWDRPDDIELDMRAVLEVAAVAPGRKRKRA